MNADEFDRYLEDQLDESPLPDHGFTRAVMVRIDRGRRRRWLAFTVAVATAAVVAVVAAGVAPDFSSAEISTRSVMAGLLLIAISSVAWIDSESTPAQR